MAVRDEAREALSLHYAGQCREALALAVSLAREHPTSAVALNLAGHLHQRAGITAWTERPPGDDRAAAAAARYHHSASLDAFSAAAALAPGCLRTAVSHADSLTACQRYADAQDELRRALAVAGTDAEIDPAAHNVRFDLLPASTETQRRDNAVANARATIQRFTTMVHDHIVPREVADMLADNARGGRHAAEARERAKLISQTFPYSGRALFLRAYMDLAQVRALDLAVDKTRLLRRTLGIVDEAAGTFERSLVIALFRAKILLVLSEFDAAENECRRALRIETPDDPRGHDIPRGSVSGADCDARVSSVNRELRVLLKQIIVLAAKYWRSKMTMQLQERTIVSVDVDTLHQHYADAIDQSAAKTISDARRFVKNHSSWSFWICPHSSCDGKKFLDTDSLWQHMCSKHREELWGKLQSILGPRLCEITLEDAYSLDGITLCQDSGQPDIFRLPRIQDMFECLLLLPSIGIQAEPSVEIRRRKCAQGAEVLECIRGKLRTLPTDTSSTEFEECSFEIQDLWLNFLEISVFDYREVILPLVRSFQWIEIKSWIALNVNTANKSIGDSHIDAVFGKVPGAPGLNVPVENVSSPTSAINTDHQNGDNLQTKKPSHSDETIKIDDKCEESEVHVEDRNSGTMLNQRLSDPTLDVHANGKNLAARIADLQLDKNGTSGQSVDQMADKELFILNLIIQSLCNLRHFRDKFLTEPLVWMPSVDNPCINQIFHDIFSAWEKNEHQPNAVLLTCLKTILCGTMDGDGTSFYEKLQVGNFFASEIVATILIGLHMSENSSRFRFNRDTERQVVNPVTCGDCICPTHNLFGIQFDAQMSCECGECSDKYLYTTLFHKLEAGSHQMTKIKSFSELQVILDPQFCQDNNCKHCGSPLSIDLFLSNTPHFVTIVLSSLGGSEIQDTFSEVLAGITSPLGTEFFCRSAHSATMYTVASLVYCKICYADDRYVCFARDEDKWRIYDSETVETENTWEHLLQRFKHCKLQPEVLIFEVIK